MKPRRRPRLRRTGAVSDDRINAFRASVAERIVQMNVNWIQLEQGVGDRDIGDSLLRVLHTLKGEASLLGFGSIAELTHALEDIVSEFVGSASSPPVETGDHVLRAFDLIISLSQGEPGAPSPEAAKFLAALREATHSPDDQTSSETVQPDQGEIEPSSPRATAPSDTRIPERTSEPQLSSDAAIPSAVPDTGSAPAGSSLESSVDAATDNAASTGDSGRTTLDPTSSLAPDDQPRAQAYQVKVNPKQLDRMRDIIGELLLTRTRLARFAAALHQERQHGSNDQQGLQPIAPSDIANDAPDHEEVLRSIEGQLRDDVLRMATLVNALDDVTRDLRMVSVSVLFERYPLAVRSMSRDLGRQVQLVTRGETVQADRDVLEALADPLLHLVRNAVDHGIELPEVREKAGKSAVGTLLLEASVVGDTLRVRVRDDGAGVDIERVRKLAIKRNVIDAGTAAVMTAREVLQCLFAPGMSTRTSITTMAGRGIGLDVVHKTVRNLGGSVDINSEPGAGTEFLLSVPIRASITSVLLFQVGRGWYALPTSALVAIEELDDYPMAISIDGPALRYKAGPLIPLIALEPVLGEPRYDSKHGRRRTRVVIVRHGSALIGLTGSYNHLQREAVLKSAGTMFSDDQLITAGLALEDGSVALVLNPGEIFRATQRKRGLDLGMSKPSAANQGAAKAKHTVLIAEDSPIVRDLIVDALSTHGLTVIEAGDGQEALEKLEAHPEIELLVTDVEMPRLTGLGLIKAMRARGGNRIPAIVVSTRGSDADKAAAVEVGADAYLVKSNFSREGLWSLVSRFLG